MNIIKRIGFGILSPVVFWILVVWGIYGCAGLGKFTPQGASIANNVVTVAQGLLHVLDGFYGNLLNLKFVPDYTTEVTRALSIADQAAMILRAAIAGATVTQEQLNVAAGQVDGAKALLEKLEVK